jgi:hypothetical protein
LSFSAFGEDFEDDDDDDDDDDDIDDVDKDDVQEEVDDEEGERDFGCVFMVGVGLFSSSLKKFSSTLIGSLSSISSVFSSGGVVGCLIMLG